MKIVCISQVYWPDTASVAQHLVDLLQALSDHGHDVTVITSRHNYEHPEICIRLWNIITESAFTVCLIPGSVKRRSWDVWRIS